MPEKLKGLRGLNDISEAERQRFMLDNADKLKAYSRTPRLQKRAAEVLFNNQQYIKTFGKDAFDKMNDGSEASYELRNMQLKDKVVNDAFNKLNPILPNGKRDNSKGLGVDWEKYNQLSTDAKQKLLESDWKTQEQLREEQKKRTGFFTKALDFFAGEAIQQYKSDKNNKIIQSIFNNDVDKRAEELGGAVASAYSANALSNMSDAQVKKEFIKAITPGSHVTKDGYPNLGIAEYAARYGDGTDVSSEMDDFTIDDMRQVLAKKAAYEQYMSPDMATTALNNDAKRYIKQHQGSAKRFGLYLKDVGISALSYSVDKVNGIYNLYLSAADQVADKPTVWVDDKGNVIDPSKVTTTNGVSAYLGEDGKAHKVHQTQVDRTTLHQMGKNLDGSEDDSFLNPTYWTRAEQFGTLSEDEQKQYEKLGVSPYKVAYNPNEDSDLMYEAFKMASFGIADGASMFIPFGIGVAGRAISTASKAGKITSTIGKAMDVTGKALSYETRAGQIMQGSAGALGIAYAYSRGAFQETLAQNMQRAEETLMDTSRNSIYERYNSDKAYKSQVDGLIANTAAQMKSEYLSQMQKDGNAQVFDEKVLDEMITAKAREAVLGDIVNKDIAERKNSKEYQGLVDKAIEGAGEAAYRSFLPEAVKYGFVNTIGFRSFLYRNPAGVASRAARNLRGLTEVTTEGGARRLGVETSKFATYGDKAKKFGKVLAAQAWGGAWTNGTDDMMVDAAERMNYDEYSQYLNNYKNGEAMADVYGFADGIYSYIHGLNNSLGQETTWRAATVGGLGSIVNFTPNMANIAHLLSKEGQQAYKNQFEKQYVRESDGITIKRDEMGNPITRDVSRGENWRERFNYFVQNGVLNEYYGAKQNEETLRNHADYVNKILDDNDDFKAIEALVASDIANRNASYTADDKTTEFVKALNAINVLNTLDKSGEEATELSSVIRQKKQFLEKIATLEENPEAFSEEEINNLIAQYYSNNPTLEQNEENNKKALQDINRNAKKLKEASDAYNAAIKEVQKIEKTNGITIDPSVKHHIATNKALGEHWKERIQKMQDEIGDSSASTTMTPESLIASVGGISNAKALASTYEKQVEELNELLSKNKENVAKAKEEYDKAKAAYDNAVSGEDKLTTSKTLKEANAKYEDAKQEEAFTRSLIAATNDNSSAVNKAISTVSNAQESEETAKIRQEIDEIQKQIDAIKEEGKNLVTKKGIFNKSKIKQKEKADTEIAKLEAKKLSKTQELNNSIVKPLTADEIMSLDPITRAKMLSKKNRDLYSPSQKREIEALESTLLEKDADALQKIQDIALLTNYIAKNKDAYNRLVQNPEAAAYRLDAERSVAATEAARIINKRVVEDVVDYINSIINCFENRPGYTREDIEELVFATLKNFHSSIIKTIDKERLLPEYQTQVTKVQPYMDTIESIDDIIDFADISADRKKALKNSIQIIVKDCNSKEDIMTALEKAIDSFPSIADEIEYIINGLVELDYQRDATVLESREERKRREEEQSEAKATAESETADLGIDWSSETESNNTETASANTEEVNNNTEDSVEKILQDIGTPILHSFGTLDNYSTHVTGSEVLRLKNRLISLVSKYSTFNEFFDALQNGGKGYSLDANDANSTKRLFSLVKKGTITPEEFADIFFSKKNSSVSTEETKAPEAVPVEKPIDKAIVIHNVKISHSDVDHGIIIPADKNSSIESTTKDIRWNAHLLVDKDGNFTMNTDTLDGGNIDYVDRSYMEKYATNDAIYKAKLGKFDELISGVIDKNGNVVRRIMTKSEANIQSSETTIGSNINKASIETKPVKEPSLSNVMDDDVTYASINAGPIWLGTTNKSKEHRFIVNKADNKITFITERGMDAESSVRTTVPIDKKDYSFTGDEYTLSSPENVLVTYNVKEREDNSFVISYDMSDHNNAPVNFNGTELMSLQITIDSNGNITGSGVETDGNTYHIGNSAKEYLQKELPSLFNREFNASSIEKVGNDWYASGTYTGYHGTSKVKLNSSFNLENAVNQEIKNQENKLISQGAKIHNSRLIDIDGYVAGNTLNVEEELKETSKEDKMIPIPNTTVESGNNVQSSMDNEYYALSGNALVRYISRILVAEKRLVLRKGADPFDVLSKYYDWMDNAGIKLQNIIDRELGSIVAKNPNMKVKFMAVVNPTSVRGNATNDQHMSNHLMLVVDYDDNINKGITSIHNDSNGGVIESKGKKYLVIGVVGYGNAKEKDTNPNIKQRQKKYDMLWNSNSNWGEVVFNLKKKRDAFGKVNPNERFYVDETLSTEIIPNSIIPGYLVKQLVDDDKKVSEAIDIQDLIDDEKRNPFGIARLGDLAWGIQKGELSQEKDSFFRIGTTKEVMFPINTEDNKGRAFVLIPASNGKMVPAYIQRTTFNNLRDGELKSEITRLLKQVTNPNKYEDRVSAITELSKYIYFSKTGVNILLGKPGTVSANRVSIFNGDSIVREFDLLDTSTYTFDFDDFYKQFVDAAPVINISPKVFMEDLLLEWYNEAGALKVDIAQLCTAGASYSIYSLNADGTIGKPNASNSDSAKIIGITSDYRNNPNIRQIDYNGKLYYSNNGRFEIDGKTVDPNNKELIKNLSYLDTIVRGNLKPIKEKGGWRYYVLDNDTVVATEGRDNTKVREVSSKEFISIMEEIKAEQERKENADRNNNAEVALEANITGPLEDVDLGEDTEIENGEIVTASNDTENSSMKANNDEYNSNRYYKQALYFYKNHSLEALNTSRRVTLQTLNEITDTDSFEYAYNQAYLKAIDDLIESKSKVKSEEFNNEEFDESKLEGTEAIIYKNGYNETVSDNKELSLSELNSKRSSAVNRFNSLDVNSKDRIYYHGVIKAFDDLIKIKESPSKTSNSENRVSSTKPVTTSGSTIPFNKLILKPAYQKTIIGLMREKFPDAGNKVSQIMEYLRKRNETVPEEQRIEIDAIDNTPDGIEAWIKTIKDCR